MRNLKNLLVIIKASINATLFCLLTWIAVIGFMSLFLPVFAQAESLVRVKVQYINLTGQNVGLEKEAAHDMLREIGVEVREIFYDQKNFIRIYLLPPNNRSFTAGTCTLLNSKRAYQRHSIVALGSFLDIVHAIALHVGVGTHPRKLDLYGEDEPDFKNVMHWDRAKRNNLWGFYLDQVVREVKRCNRRRKNRGA